MRASVKWRYWADVIRQPVSSESALSVLYQAVECEAAVCGKCFWNERLDLCANELRGVPYPLNGR